MSLRAAAGRTEPGAGAVLLSSSDVVRVIDRMSHQIIENLEKTGSAGLANAVLMGIPSRGVPLAKRLATRIEAFCGTAIPVGSLDITLYRDDLRQRGIRPLGETVEPAGGIDGKTVILVDDVLFSGRSTRAALDALSELGRPSAVQLAVMVDRGHRQLPIRADYVGKNVPTARSESVRVNLAETDGEDGVVLVEGTQS
jgi:pyrimidine operon attenuation protein/uracil phosphoribosyltransferase